MTKLVSFTDIHYGKRQNNEIFQITNNKVVEEIISYSRNNNIRYGVFNGDWFNDRTNINSRTLHYSTLALRMINDYFKSVDGMFYIIVGNHDLFYRQSRSITSLEISRTEYSHITLVDEPMDVDVDGHIISLSPWLTDQDDIADIFHNAKGEYLFCHGEFRDFKWNSNSLMLTGGIPREIASKFKHVFSGHYHLRQTKGNITYIGSVQQQDFGDANTERGWMVLDLEDDNFIFIDNNISPKFYKIPLSELADKVSLVKGNHITIIEDIELKSDQFSSIHDHLTKKEPSSLIFEASPVEDKPAEDVDDIDMEEIGSVDSLLTHMILGIDRSKERGKILQEHLA